MSLRSALRGLVLASAGAAAVLGAAVLISPALRRRALQLAGRSPEPEPQEPTHIVLPDRALARWEGLEEAIEEGREIGSGDVALAGA
ncbi:MAG TPA: hypothetical protein VFC09_10665 [Candidatus Dormibacteraeota bacterium]|nr:hypothetical protein [Candidatus Dormibacteraeota bacterium]